MEKLEDEDPDRIGHIFSHLLHLGFKLRRLYFIWMFLIFNSSYYHLTHSNLSRFHSTATAPLDYAHTSYIPLSSPCIHHILHSNSGPCLSSENSLNFSLLANTAQFHQYSHLFYRSFWLVPHISHLAILYICRFPQRCLHLISLRILRRLKFLQGQNLMIFLSWNEF